MLCNTSGFVGFLIGKNALLGKFHTWRLHRREGYIHQICRWTVQEIQISGKGVKKSKKITEMRTSYVEDDPFNERIIYYSSVSHSLDHPSQIRVRPQNKIPLPCHSIRPSSHKLPQTCLLFYRIWFLCSSWDDCPKRLTEGESIIWLQVVIHPGSLPSERDLSSGVFSPTALDWYPLRWAGITTSIMKLQTKGLHRLYS